MLVEEDPDPNGVCVRTGAVPIGVCVITTTHLINASSPRSLILTVSLLWFNFRFDRYPGAIPSLAARFVTCAAFDEEAWMITR